MNTSDEPESLFFTDSDQLKNIENFILSFSGENKKVLGIGTQSTHFLKLLKNSGCKVSILNTKPSLQENQSPFTQILVDSFEENFTKYPIEKYDIIIIIDIFERLMQPDLFLKKIKNYLLTNGILICSISNIAHGSMRLKFLDGNFTYKKTGLLKENHLRFFTLDSILALLEKCNYSMTRLLRVDEDIFSKDGSELKQWVIHDQLIKAILTDPEATTYYYIFSAIPIDKSSTTIQELISEFPKVRTTESLRNFIDLYAKDIFSLKAKVDDLSKLIEINEKNQKTIESASNSIKQISSEKSTLLEEISKLQKINLENQEKIKQLQAELDSQKNQF